MQPQFKSGYLCAMFRYYILLILCFPLGAAAQQLLYGGGIGYIPPSGPDPDIHTSFKGKHNHLAANLKVYFALPNIEFGLGVEDGGYMGEASLNRIYPALAIPLPIKVLAASPFAAPVVFANYRICIIDELYAYIGGTAGYMLTSFSNTNVVVVHGDIKQSLSTNTAVRYKPTSNAVIFGAQAGILFPLNDNNSIDLNFAWRKAGIKALPDDAVFHNELMQYRVSFFPITIGFRQNLYRFKAREAVKPAQ